MALLRPRVFTRSNDEATSPLDNIPISAELYEPEPPTEFRDEMPVLGMVEEEVEVETLVPVNIRISSKLYDEYRKVAAAQELTVEELIQHRVSKCRSHNARRGLWFSDSEHVSLENMLQKWPLEDSKQALALISKALNIHFDDVLVTLTPAQKKVLAARTKTPKLFFEAMLKREFRV